MTRHRSSPGILSTIPAIAAATILMSGCAAPSLTALYGEPAPEAVPTRTVQLTPSTQYVNVTNGETVRFVSDGQAFTWNFNAVPTVNQFDLAEVAPANVVDHKVIAYISPDPKYLGP